MYLTASKPTISNHLQQSFIEFLSVHILLPGALFTDRE